MSRYRTVPALRDRLALRPRTAGALASVGLLVLAFLYDFLGPGVASLPHGWDPRRTTWLLALSLVFLGWYGLGTVVANPRTVVRVWPRLRRRPGALLATAYLLGFLFVGLAGPTLVGEPSIALELKFQPPVFASVDDVAVQECIGTATAETCSGSWQHPLGTNGSGHDMVTLLVHGARVTLIVALVSGGLIVPIAISVGLIAAYAGGTVDQLLMRYVDVQQTIPAFVIYLILRLLWGSSLFLVVLVFGLLSWGGVARLVRADAIRYRDAAHVQAAESIGAGRLHVLRTHLLPMVSPTAIAATTRKVPDLILAQAGLAFLDLNDVMVPSWGHVMGSGLNDFWTVVPNKWWVSAVPAIALALTVLAFNVFGNAVREVLDPRSHR